MPEFRVFVAEDDVSANKIVVDFVKQKGYATECSFDGMEAFEKVSSDISKYYLLIIDINMPKLNGLKLISKLKEAGYENKIAIMSTLSEVEIFKDAIRLGVDYFIDKPIGLDILGDTLTRAHKSFLRKAELDCTMQLLEEYKEAVDESNIVSKTDTKGRITYANEQFCKISGYTLDELLGKSHNIIRHPEVPSEVFADLWDTVKNKKQTWKGVVKNRKKDGGEYIVDATIVPVMNVNGDILEYIAIRHDITELEHYKQLLEDQLDVSIQSLQEKMNLLSEYEKAINLSAPFSRIDTGGNITYANGAFEEMTGFRMHELVGNNFYDVFSDSAALYIFEGAVTKVKKTKQPWKGLVIFSTKNGDSIYLNCSLVPIVNLDGKIVEIMGIYADITEVVSLNKEIEDTQKEIVTRVGIIGESRSKETGEHVKRVAEISAVLAKSYGLDYREVNLIKSASPMHDIGKIAIPDSILQKTSRLTEEEFEAIKTHSEIGYNMLKGSERDLLKAAAVIAYEHHERWDGKGYPRGLAGEDIHIYGRITAVADVYDALSTERCYKKAWPLDEVLNLFKEERGRQFDPKFIDLFFENLDEITKISDNLKDS